MSLFAPLALLGLATLAIPVLLHLIQREKRTLVEFPSLMFLRRVPYHSVRRRRIRNWLLLALRLLALALIVGAFARPFIRQADATTAAAGGRDVVVLLDRSFSMGYTGTWARAQAAARQTLQELGPDDRASLVLFSDEAETVSRSSSDRALLVAAVDAAMPDAGATRYGSAIKLAGSLLAQSPLLRREVVLISDFQRAGWEPDQTLRFASGTTLRTLSVRADSVTDLAATPVTLQREMFSGRERVVVSGGLINRGAQAVHDVPLQLEIDGRVVQTVPVSADPYGAVSATFAPLTLAGPLARGSVRVPADALTRDDVFHFALSPSAPLPVTLVTRAGASRDDTFYLTRALSIGDRPRFDVTPYAGEDVSAEALRGARVVLVSDTAVSAGSAARLARFVSQGGGLIVLLGPRSTWPENEDGLLGGRIGPEVDRTRGLHATLTRLEYGHVVFEPFRAPRSGDFSSAHIYGYRSFETAADAAVLARFDDGAAALIESKTGAGRVLVWSSSLDLGWSDLPLKPVFLPFLHRLVSYTANYREQPSSLTIGQVLELSPRAQEQARVVVTPAGARLTVDPASAALTLREQGFYDLRASQDANRPLQLVASNVDLQESDLTPVDPQEIVAAVAGGAPSAIAGGADTPSDESFERAQRLWWFILFAGILLLTVETWLAQRVSRAAR